MADIDLTKHKDLEEINDRIIFLRDSFLGGDNYKRGKYLPPYPREEKDDYDRCHRGVSGLGRCNNVAVQRKSRRRRGH